MSDELSLRLDVLDAEIVDADEIPIGRVSDVLLSAGDGEPPRIEALATGSQALGDRLHGLAGTAMARVSAQLRPGASGPGPTTIDVEHVAEIDLAVRLHLRLDELPHVAALEHWLARNVVGRIPGSGHAGE